MKLFRSFSKPALLTGYLMVEALVYIGVLFALLGVGYVALYRCIDRSLVLRRNIDDMTMALHVGERWRADVHASDGRLRAETEDEGGQIFVAGSSRGEVAWLFSTNTILRRVGQGRWNRLLSGIRSSSMAADARATVIAWRWELELEPRSKGSANSSRVRPLFTFTAVPTSSLP